MNIRLFLVPVALSLAACAGGGMRADAPDLDPVTELALDPKEVNYHVILAEMALEGEEYPVAAREYATAAEMTADTALLARAAEVAFDFGTPEETLATLRRWASLDPFAVAPRQYLARYYLRYDQAPLAVAHLDFLYGALGRGAEDGFSVLLPVLGEARDPRVAMQAMAYLLEAYPREASAHHAYAWLALRAAELDLAVKHASIALDLDPVWTDAAVLYARALLANGRTDEALEYLAGRVGLDGDVRLRLEYSVLLIAADRVDEARAILVGLLRDQPGMPGALRTLGFLELQEGNLDLAERHFTALAATGRSLGDAMYYLGDIEERRDDLRAAARYYARVTEGEHAATAQIRLALILFRLGQEEGAVRHLQDFARHQPLLAADMVAAEGELLVRMGQPERALEVYAAALERNPNDVTLMYSRAFLLERLDRVDEAIAMMRDILALQPDNATALNALGYTLTDRTDRHREARRYIRRALELEPDSAAIIDSMGWVEYRLGNLDAALAHLERAWSMDRDPEIASHLGEVLWMLGRQDEARAIWEESLQENPTSEVVIDTMERLGA